ncbi:fatty acid desaturase family protein [Nocardia sp. IBHARD005]|uniref:fatty acid desaturase family protein n=1 Tax=Nocardia sp. IBHARD005 TaxID=3457765 RepID=UPI0040588D7E
MFRPSVPVSRRRSEEAGTTVVLTAGQVEELGRELDAVRARFVADLGEKDRAHIYRIIKVQQAFEVAGRGLMYLGFRRPFWLAAIGALSVSKILDNMEVGHNVLHGQYDWMREPGVNSRDFDFDMACASDQWKHSHNYKHHTYTNIVGRDRDLGYGLFRMDEGQEWKPAHLAGPMTSFLLMVFFEWALAVYDLEPENIAKGNREWREVEPLIRGALRKAGRQVLKDYIVFPALTGPLFVKTLCGNAIANVVRNVWTYSIILCGHFPTGAQTFTDAETANETRGEWYVRQMLGSGNIEGGKLFHTMSGHLSHHIEHHLFPDIPAHRYPEMSGEIRAVCERHGVPYRTGGFFGRLGSTWARVFRLALPPKLVRPRQVPAVTIQRRLEPALDTM